MINLDLLNQPVAGEATQGGGVDFSVPFVKGDYLLEIVEVGDWKARPEVKNYEVKKWDFKSKSMQVVEVLDSVTPLSCMIKLRVIEAPEGHEALEGREWNEFLNFQPNTMFIISSFIASVVGEGVEYPPAMFNELEGFQLTANVEPDTYTFTKTTTDPNTGLEEHIEEVRQSAKVNKYLPK